MLYSKNSLSKVAANVGLNLLNYNLDAAFIQLGHEVEEINTINVNKLVVGKVIEVKPHPDSDHLHVCQVNVGKEVIQIVCGASNVVENALVIVARDGAKLPSGQINNSEIRGVKSEGMLCALEEIGFDKKYVNPQNLDHIFIFPPNSVDAGSSVVDLLSINDSIYDVALTANRGDCLSYLGMMRDLYALTSKNTGQCMPLSYVNINQINQGFVNDNGFSSAFFNLVNPNQLVTPVRLSLFLAKHQIPSINIITDTLNALTILTGQVFNAYDAQKISGQQLQIIQVTQPQEVELVNEGNIELQVGDYVVVDAQNRIIGVPNLGVVSGYEVTSDTSMSIVGMINMDPNIIRKMNYHLYIKNENSIRSEKGIDINLIPLCLDLLFKATQRYNLEYGVFHYTMYTNQIKEVMYNVTTFKRVIGIDIPATVQKQYLNALGFNVIGNVNNPRVQIPSWRFDIFHDQDLVEEMLRLYGVDNVSDLEVLETIIHPNKVGHTDELLDNKLVNILLESGLNQVITYSLVSVNGFNDFNKVNKMPINLLSPLSQDHSVYRHSLIPSLLEVAQYNFDHQAQRANYFELGDTYYKLNDQIYVESHLAGVVGGINTRNINGSVEHYNYDDVASILNNVFKLFDAEFSIEPTTMIDELNPYAQGIIKCRGVNVGLVGIKHPHYFKKLKQQMICFEINLNQIKHLLIETKEYQPINMLPTITRQLTFNVDNDVDFLKLSTSWSNINYLQDARLISVYKHDQNSDIKKISVEFYFNANVSLTKEDIDPLVEEIINNAKEINVSIDN